MDLPTYTNIWRIEKRLYKLYDFRLPMPLPINWLAVFTAITVPYIVLLIAVGLPFNHTLLWLYVLPPGLLTWLTTRPVIEGKRLPELVESQARYLTEPRTWVRLVPLSEKDQMVLTARVWRGRQAPRRSGVVAPSAATASMAATVKAGLARDARDQGRQGDGRHPGGGSESAAAATGPVRERDHRASRLAGRPARNTRGARARQADAAEDPGARARWRWSVGPRAAGPRAANGPHRSADPAVPPLSPPSYPPTSPSRPQPPVVVPGMVEGSAGARAGRCTWCPASRGVA